MSSMPSLMTCVPAMTKPLSEDGAPSTSIARLNAFGEAIWAVYDLRGLIEKPPQRLRNRIRLLFGYEVPGLHGVTC